jgi:hypothetical protein
MKGGIENGCSMCKTVSGQSNPKASRASGTLFSESGKRFYEEQKANLLYFDLFYPKYAWRIVDE